MNIYESNYREFANKTLSWLPMDTEELFKSNLRSKRPLLELNDWVNTTIEYRFNSNGFRSPDFQPNGAMFLGCSNTCGIGLPEESLWAYQVAKNINLPYCNLGIGGGSANTAFRLGFGWIPKLLPKLVVYVEPPPMRFEFINSYEIDMVLSSDHSKKSVNEFYKLWVTDEYNNQLNYSKNQLALQAVCYSHKIKFVSLKSQNLYQLGTANDYARDLAHCGRQTNLRFAEFVLNVLNET